MLKDYRKSYLGPCSGKLDKVKISIHLISSPFYRVLFHDLFLAQRVNDLKMTMIDINNIPVKNQLLSCSITQHSDSYTVTRTLASLNSVTVLSPDVPVRKTGKITSYLSNASIWTAMTCFITAGLSR